MIQSMICNFIEEEIANNPESFYSMISKEEMRIFEDHDFFQTGNMEEKVKMSAQIQLFDGASKRFFDELQFQVFIFSEHDYASSIHSYDVDKKAHHAGLYLYK